MEDKCDCQASVMIPSELTKFEVFGLAASPQYQKCKFIVKKLYQKYPEYYSEPTFKPMFNVEWKEFIERERHLNTGRIWSLDSPVAVFKDDFLMGDEKALCEHISSRYVFGMNEDFVKRGEEEVMDILMKQSETGRRHIYLMIAINKVLIGSMLFLLFWDVVPENCELFLERCKTTTGGYAGTKIHRIVPGCWVQGGEYDLVPNPCMLTENFALTHNTTGTLSMCRSTRHKHLSTQFFITLSRCDWMDRQYVVIGQLIQGIDVLDKIANTPHYYGKPLKDIEIVKTGEYNLCITLHVRDGGTFERYINKREKSLGYRAYKVDFRDDVTREKDSKYFHKKHYLASDMRSYLPFRHLPDENNTDDDDADALSEQLIKVENL